MTRRIRNEGRKKVAVGAFAAVMLATQPVVAQDILLESSDGALSIDGQFLSFDGTHYIIRTELGDLRVAADIVTCSGLGCPSADSTRQVVARPARVPMPPRSELVNISGSNALGETLMPLLVEGYADSFDGAIEALRNNEVEKILSAVEDSGFGDTRATFRVMSSLSSDAFANLIGQSTEIGMSSEPIPEAAASILQTNGAGDMRSAANEHIIALDNIVVVTHPGNPLNTMSMAQLADIYAGTVSNWAEIGGPDAPITVVNRMAGTATRTIFENRVFAEGAGGSPVNQVVVNEFSDVADAVYAEPTAIGYVPMPFTRGAKPLNLINECGIEMSPDAFSARTEEYNLGRFLYLYSRSDTLSPEAAAFLDYVKSPAAEPVILKAGYIDLGVARQVQDMESYRARELAEGAGNRLERTTASNMLAAMASHDRLSSTFRFATGSDRLNDRGVLNLERLVDYAQDLPAGTRLVFVGFADSVGDFARNITLSEARAARVLRAFRNVAGSSVDGLELATLGFGEIAPAACNTEAEGRAINRRVEVWIENASG